MALMRQIWDEARAIWPDVPLPYARFSEYLSERVPRGTDLAQTLADTHGADLYLACACAAGEPAALAAFERKYLPQVEAHLRGRNLMPESTDEVKQQLRS